jgi:hypothetical protein
VFRKLIDELVAPICSRVAEVQVARCYELNAFRSGSRSGAVPVMPNADGCGGGSRNIWVIQVVRLWHAVVAPTIPQRPAAEPQFPELMYPVMVNLSSVVGVDSTRWWCRRHSRP